MGCCLNYLLIPARTIGGPFSALHFGQFQPTRVRGFKKVPQRADAERVPPSPPPMLGRVVDHVTALAQRREVGRGIIARIVVEVGTREHDVGGSRRVEDVGPEPDHPPPSRSPGGNIRVPPAAVAQVDDVATVRTPAPLATRTGTTEPNHGGQLGPVDRVEPSVFGADRHLDSMSQPARERKKKVSCPVRVP